MGKKHPAIREFEQVESMDWSEGLSLPALLEWMGCENFRGGV